MDLLDDATALHLEAAQEALRQAVRDIAQGSSVVVRKRGGWYGASSAASGVI